MKIIIINAKESSMPEQMVQNCEKLLERRIRKLIQKGNSPKEGNDVDILYSESDPLMQREPWGDDAYGIYFTIKQIDSFNKTDLEEATIEVELHY